MRTKQWNGDVDRKPWGDGPWRDEPDRRQWVDRETGLPCLARRTELGNLCGYVGVSPGHPLHRRLAVELTAHGGITYTGRQESVIAFELEPEDEQDLWLFGFDCGHFGDLVPSIAALLPGLSLGNGTYRDFRYVEIWCRELAAELSALLPPPVIAPTDMVPVKRSLARRNKKPSKE